jgi:hypothetical protein
VDVLLRAAAEPTPAVEVGNPMELISEAIAVQPERSTAKDMEVMDQEIVIIDRPQQDSKKLGKSKQTNAQPVPVNQNDGQVIDVQPKPKKARIPKSQANGAVKAAAKKDLKVKAKKTNKNRSYSSDDSELTSLSDEDPRITHVQLSPSVTTVPVPNGNDRLDIDGDSADQPRKSSRQRKPNIRLLDQIDHATGTDARRAINSNAAQPNESISRPGSGSGPGSGVSSSRPKRMASGAAQVKIEQAVEKFGPIRSGSAEVRSRTAELYELEQELMERQQADQLGLMPFPTSTSNQGGGQVMDVDVPKVSPSTKRKRMDSLPASPVIQQQHASPKVHNGRRKAADVDSDYTDTSRASPKRHRSNKQKAIVLSDSESEAKARKRFSGSSIQRYTGDAELTFLFAERSERYTSPIHGRRKVQRPNYNEVDLQARCE